MNHCLMNSPTFGTLQRRPYLQAFGQTVVLFSLLILSSCMTLEVETPSLLPVMSVLRLLLVM